MTGLVAVSDELNRAVDSVYSHVTWIFRFEFQYSCDNFLVKFAPDNEPSTVTFWLLAGVAVSYSSL